MMNPSLFPQSTDDKGWLATNKGRVETRMTKNLAEAFYDETVIASGVKLWSLGGKSSFSICLSPKN